MKNKGFTLVEILVVISIVAILATIGMAIFRGSTNKARDSIRKDDLNKLALALEIYAKNNGSYITTASNCSSSSTFYSAIASFMNGPAPKDPKDQSQYCYISADGKTYELWAKLENDSCPAGITCPSGGYNYKIEPK